MAASPRAAAGDSLRPIQVGPGLPVSLDMAKRERFPERWQHALSGRGAGMTMTTKIRPEEETLALIVSRSGRLAAREGHLVSNRAGKCRPNNREE